MHSGCSFDPICFCCYFALVFAGVNCVVLIFLSVTVFLIMPNGNSKKEHDPNLCLWQGLMPVSCESSLCCSLVFFFSLGRFKFCLNKP